MKRHISIRHRMIIYILLGCLTLFFSLGILGYKSVGRLLITQCQENGLSLAKTAAAELPGDVIEDIRETGDEPFNQIMKILDKYSNYATVKYIYTMKLVDDKAYFIVDTDHEDPSEYMEEYPEVEQDMLTAFSGTPVYNKEVTADKWGAYYSAYAPVYNSDNAIVAIVGVDVDIEEVYAYLAKLRHIVTTVAVVTLLAVAVIFLIMYFDTLGKDKVTELFDYDRFTVNGRRLAKKGVLSKYTAILVNIYDFKYFNKKYGYDTGNVILYQLGRYLKKNLKWPSKVARNGNDNFVLLVKNEQVQSFLKSLSDIEFEVTENNSASKIQVVVRCGVYEIADGDKFTTAIERCVVAMNKARRETIYEPVYYNQNVYDEMEQEREILALYKKAIERKEFCIYYQPKVDPKTKRLCGAEALVRWFHDGKMIPPGIFIPIIEKEGLVSALDYHVLKLVCEDIREWVEAGLEPVRVSTNFSKLHLLEQDFSKRVLGIIDEYHVNHKYLNIEMTESSGYANMNALTSFLSDMKKNQIYVSMDDFGTGYSSLSMLGDMEWDEIKIDKSLVDMIESSQEKATMVKNIIQIIHDLNRVVICEGVETKTQLEFLSDTECHMIQGYYFDKPLPKDDFRNRLEKPVYEGK